MRLAHLAAAVVLVGLLAGLLGAAALARADGPPESSEPPVEGWSADPRLWLALIEWRQRLRLELASSRELCTAGTLTEISWQINGGTPPYELQVAGSPVNADADNIRINCGALTEAEAADEDAALAAKRVSAVVTDARGVRREAALDVARARALPAPTGVWYQTNVGGVTVSWDEVEGAGSQSPTIVSGNDRRRVTGVMRTRASRDGAAWSYQTVTRLYADEWDLGPTSGVRVLSVAAVRHPLETETPGALNWSDDLEYASTTLAQNVTLTATHDTVTASWDRQPYAGGQQVLVTLQERSQVDRRGDRRASGYRFLQLWEQEGVGGRHRVTFSHLPPDTDLRLAIEMHHHTGDAEEPDYSPDTTSHNVRTLPAPAGWVPAPAGPQNLRYTEVNGSITVTWDDPYSNAEPNWFLTIENPLTGARWVTWVSGTSWSLPADLVVLPDTQYRVTVEHIDVVVGSASILLRTPPAPAAGQAESPTASDVSPPELRLRTLHDFFPIWPVMVDSDYTMTDDPFQWRNDTDKKEKDEPAPPGHYHRGLDIGEYSRNARRVPREGQEPPPYGSVTGDGVYAATSGVLRVFTDDLSKTSVVHCPSDDIPLHEQFYVAGKGASSIMSGAIKDDGLDGSANEGDLPRDVFCLGIATEHSGRVAVIAYARSDGLQIVTKYAHLSPNGFPETITRALATNPNECEPMKRDGVKCLIDSNKSVTVQQGDRIATIGNSASGTDGSISPDVGFDQHVHFEILHLKGPRGAPSPNHRVLSIHWRSATFCSDEPRVHANNYDCRWSGDGPREMGTALDVEAYLPPLPASSLPKNARNVVTDGRRGKVDTNRHIVEVDEVNLQRTQSAMSLIAKLSVAFWRPSFYAQYYSNPDHVEIRKRGQISRTGRAGIASTGPGVDAYYTHLECAGSQATSNGPFQGQASEEGEIARAVLEDVSLSVGTICTVTVRASNEHWERQHPGQILDRASQNITLRDPSATLAWVADLPVGANVVRVAKNLTGNALDLYTFTARRGYTYRFCTYPSSQSTNECADESEDSKNRNIAQLLIIGADTSTTDDAVKNTSGLTWTVPDNAPLEGDYVLVVRRRARVEGSVDDYSYRLKYTVPSTTTCRALRSNTVSGAQAAPYYICIPATPTISPSVERTADSITFKWNAAAVPVEYQVRWTKGSTVSTATTPNNPAGARSHHFAGLEANKEYTVEVKALNKINGVTVAESGWASVSATTSAEQLPKPSGLSVTNVGENSLTLNWSEVADAGGYKVKRTGSSSTWTLPSTSRSHRFTGLTPNFRYTLYVQALPKAGSSKVASAWADEPGRTDSAEPPPTPQPPTPSLTTCLSSARLEAYANWFTDDSHCRSVRASALWSALRSAGIEVGCISRLILGSGEDPMWERYQAAGSRTNFLLRSYDILWLSRSACPTGSGVSGSSDAGALNCAEAVKPETGPAAVSVGGAACVIVRGGGAVQVSDGERTLNLTLSNGRDWVLFAASEFTGSSAGAFWVYDLTSGGWIALYPPDGFELERHIPADAAGLPALLDAIAASAAPSVYPAADR